MDEAGGMDSGFRWNEGSQLPPTHPLPHKGGRGWILALAGETGLEPGVTGVA